MNPYYNAEELELDMIVFDEPDLSCAYNTLCFWATKDGQVYSAHDSGCSCPTPFENAHDRKTRDEVLQTLERIGSIEQAESIFDAWNEDYDNKPLVNIDERRKLSLWISSRLKL